MVAKLVYAAGEFPHHHHMLMMLMMRIDAEFPRSLASRSAAARRPDHFQRYDRKIALSAAFIVASRERVRG